MATISYRSAVADAFGHRFTGLIGYVMWAFVHVWYLIGWGNRIGTIYQWFRNLVFTKNRNHRIITYSRAKKDIGTGRLPTGRLAAILPAASRPEDMSRPLAVPARSPPPPTQPGRPRGRARGHDRAGDGGPVQVFVDLTRFAATATRAQLRDRVRELEDVGATGVSVSDHIFFTSGGRPRADGVGHGCDPLTTLAAVAGLSERLAVQTVVMNSAWMHPGLLLRQFAQLAVLLGGERVTAGLGAGWSAEEFDALGLAMPTFRTRIDRLAEVLAVARGLWTRRDGDATTGGHVVARDLPLSPVPDRPPRLLVGGGSDRLLGMAGRFADLLDLHGDPKHGRVAGATMAQASAGDVARRAHTTVDDLAGRIGLVRDARRPRERRDAVGWRRRSGTSPSVARGVRTAEELCARWAGIPYRPLDRSPYLLFGSPAQMAEALAERRRPTASSGSRSARRAGSRPRRRTRSGSAEVLPLLGLAARLDGELQPGARIRSAGGSASRACTGCRPRPSCSGVGLFDRRHRSRELTGREPLLQLLQGTVLRLGKEHLEEGDRDQAEDDEDQEGSLDPDGLDDDREEERDDRVGHPQAQHADAHSQAAQPQREHLRDDDPHRDVQGQLHAEDEGHHEEEDHERLR